MVNSNCYYGSQSEVGVRMTALLHKIRHTRGKRNEVE